MGFVEDSRPNHLLQASNAHGYLQWGFARFFSLWLWIWISVEKHDLRLTFSLAKSCFPDTICTRARLLAMMIWTVQSVTVPYCLFLHGHADASGAEQRFLLHITVFAPTDKTLSLSDHQNNFSSCCRGFQKAESQHGHCHQLPSL